MWKNDNVLDLGKERENELVTTQAAATLSVVFLVCLFCFNSCQKRYLWELDCLTFQG